MGDLNINQKTDRSKYLTHLLNDVKSLDHLLNHKKIESGIQRIGAEQEFTIVEPNFRPSNKSLQILEQINDDHFTTELAIYNLEINLDPQSFSGDGLEKLQNQLDSLMEKAHKAAEKSNTKIILTGILPSIRQSDIHIDYITPLPRYKALDKVMREAKGENFRINISGVDEFHISHDNILIEACNTSFQTHLQVSPDEFTDMYNWAQVIAGPVLSACTNSPLLLENELWMETRIALFQQSCDIRQVNHAIRKKQPRVSFGFDWVKNGINDLYKSHISKYKLLLTREINESSLELIKQNKTPKLEALCLHNGTVYLWNRPCYGVGNGVPHIRIENRYLPSGPTTVDEVANLAFWVGLMNGMPDEAKNIWEKMDFVDASSNFTKSARYGLNSQFEWFGENLSAKELILDRLLPLARKGLQKAKINSSDILKYLEIIEERVRSGKTGSSWTVRTYRNYKKTLSDKEAIIALTKTMYEWQNTGKPVHEWHTPEKTKIKHEGNYERVDEFMNVHIITLLKNDLVELGQNIMDWNNIRHIAIENEKEELVGLLTKSLIDKAVREGKDLSKMIIQDIMRTEIVTSNPEMSINDAVDLMVKANCTCLPIIHDNELVGILTDQDITPYKHKLNLGNE